MNEIDKFFGKGIKKKIQGVELEFSPLTTEHLSLLMDLADEKKRTGSIKLLLDIYLKQLFPEATDGERKKVSLEFLNDFLIAIMEVNGLQDDGKLRESIKKPE